VNGLLGTQMVRRGNPVLNAVLTVTTCLATALGAQLKFNLGPVPYTMQNFGFILAGLLLPPKWALASQLLYLLLIAIGAPVAAGFRGGPYVLIGFTAGYLWMFPVASLLMSLMSRWYLRRVGRSLSSIRVSDVTALLGISLVATLPVYFVGFLVFLHYALPSKGLMGWVLLVNKLLGIKGASAVTACFVASVLIFIPQDLLMDHLAAILTSKAVHKVLVSRGLVSD